MRQSYFLKNIEIADRPRARGKSIRLTPQPERSYPSTVEAKEAKESQDILNFEVIQESSCSCSEKDKEKERIKELEKTVKLL